MPESVVGTYVPVPIEVQAAQIVSSPGDDDMPNRLSIAAVSGWLMAHGFHDFKVVTDHGELGLDLYTRWGPEQRASPGDWIVLDRGVFRVEAKEAFADRWYEA